MATAYGHSGQTPAMFRSAPMTKLAAASWTATQILIFWWDVPLDSTQRDIRIRATTGSHRGYPLYTKSSRRTNSICIGIRPRNCSCSRDELHRQRNSTPNSKCTQPRCNWPLRLRPAIQWRSQESCKAFALAGFSAAMPFWRMHS